MLRQYLNTAWCAENEVIRRLISAANLCPFYLSCNVWRRKADTGIGEIITQQRTQHVPDRLTIYSSKGYSQRYKESPQNSGQELCRRERLIGQPPASQKNAVRCEGDANDCD